MRCLGCQYDISKLSEHRCPECGREFDPDDPDSFNGGKAERSDWSASITALFLVGLVIGLFGLILWLFFWPAVIFTRGLFR